LQQVVKFSTVFLSQPRLFSQDQNFIVFVFTGPRDQGLGDRLCWYSEDNDAWYDSAVAWSCLRSWRVKSTPNTWRSCSFHS